MSLYPTFDAPDLMMDEVEEELEDVRSYKYNINEAKTLVTGSGKTLPDTPEEAYRFWVVKCVVTERYKYKAYDSDFGVEYEWIMRQGYSRSIAESEIRRTVTEALFVDDRTVGVSDFKFKWSGDSCWIEFVVTSVYGVESISIERGGVEVGRVIA